MSKKLLLCRPTYFDVVYKINAHMKEGSVDPDEAMRQWEAMLEVYRMIACDVEIIEGQPGQPDMVFAANQSLPYLRKGKKHAVLSNMFAEERRGEVPFFKTWLEENGYTTHPLPEGEFFESMGDMVWSGDRSFLWGGYGFRTTRSAQESFEKITGIEIKALKLVSEYGYHLNVCYCTLNEDCSLAYKPAFDEASWALLKENIKDLIEVSKEDMMNFACNAFCPDGKHVILHEGSDEATDAMRQRGFIVHEIDTSEFIKAGGSVFCMKLELPA